MNDSPTFTRRGVLRAGAIGGLAAAAAALAADPAQAAQRQSGTNRPSGPRITDLGPAVEQFGLMSALLVGDSVYIGSRNLDPAGVIRFDLTSHTVTAKATAGTGYSVQAIAADASGRYLYFGVLQKTGGPQPNLYRWDLQAPGAAAVAIGQMGDRDVRDIAVAPDGVVFAVGGGSPTAPALWEYDPATGTVTSRGIPDAHSTLARAVAATDDTVFFGAGSTLGGGGGASRASLFAYDRATGTFRSVVPNELAVDPSIRELAVVGDHLVVSTAASTASTKIAVMDLADLSSYTVVTSIGKTAKNFASIGDHLYFANEAGIVDDATTTSTVTQLDVGGLDLGEIWGVDARNGTLVVVSASGFVAEIDPATGASTVTDLADAGAPADPQTCMGIAAGAGYVYVGGNGVIARHSLSTGEVVNLQAPGEAKDAEVIDGVLYTGQYNSQGIWSYDPSSGAPIHQVASFAGGQNRPLDTTWDEIHQLLLVAVQSDTEGGGSLWAYSPSTKQSTIVINPIDDVQLVRAVATSEGIAYLGGDNAQATGARGTVVAWDPVARTELWRIETGMPKGVAALAVRDHHLYGLTIGGGVFVVDLRTRAIVHTENRKDLCPGFAAMVVNRGVVYAVSDTTLFRFDPRTFAVTVVVADIDGAWYSGSHLNVDEAGRIYTIRGRNLVQIDDRPHT
jgi:hypothetical protein